MSRLIPSYFKPSKNQRRNQRRRQKRNNFKQILKSVVSETYKPVRRNVRDYAKTVMPADMYENLGSVYQGVSRGVKRGRQKRQPLSPSLTSSVGNNQSTCGAQLLDCINSPFSFYGEICLPIHPIVPTFKTKIISNFTMTAGTNGVAFFLYAPCLSQDVSIYYTQQTYAGNVFSDDTAATGVVGIANGSLFTALQFDTDFGEGIEPLSGRVNLISFQVTPLASFMNRKGLLRLTVDPNRSSLSGLSGTDCANWHSTVTYNVATLVSSSPTPSISIMATSQQELALRMPQGITAQANNTRFPWSNEFLATGGLGSGMIGAFVDGAAVGDAFNVKMITRVEYTGAIVSSYSTIGASNPEAFAYASSYVADLLYQQSSTIH